MLVLGLPVVPRVSSLVLASLVLLACGQPTTPSSPTSPSQDDGSKPTPPSDMPMLDLKYGSFSGDGARVAAAWRVPPRNRAGTDDSTAVGMWNLDSGDSVVLPGASGPVALSPDGATLLAVMPTGAPALLPFGQVEPTTMLPMPAAGQALVAATFDPAGGDLVGLTAGGSLLRWELARMGMPTQLDTLPAEVTPQRWQAAAMSFDSGGTRLLLVGLPIDVDPNHPRMQKVTWQLAAGRFERLLVEELEAVDGHPITPLVVVRRIIGGEITSTAPSGEQVTRKVQTPHVEPAFTSPDGRRRLVDDGSKLLVETDDGRQIELRPEPIDRPVRRPL
jgi:hypothetical protein